MSAQTSTLFEHIHEGDVAVRFLVDSYLQGPCATSSKASVVCQPNDKIHGLATTQSGERVVIDSLLRHSLSYCCFRGTRSFRYGKWPLDDSRRVQQSPYSNVEQDEMLAVCSNTWLMSGTLSLKAEKHDWSTARRL